MLRSFVALVFLAVDFVAEALFVLCTCRRFILFSLEGGRNKTGFALFALFGCVLVCSADGSTGNGCFLARRLGGMGCVCSKVGAFNPRFVPIAFRFGMVAIKKGGRGGMSSGGPDVGGGRDG